MTATNQTATARVKASRSEPRLPQSQRSGRTASISRGFDSRTAGSSQPVAQPAWQSSDPAWAIEGGQNVPQPAAVELSNHLAIMGDRDDAGLFRDDHRHRIADFAEPQRGSVTQAKLAPGAGGQSATGGQWHHAGGGRDPIAPDDHRSVVQWSIYVENLDQQLGGEPGIQGHSGLDVLVEPVL